MAMTVQHDVRCNQAGDTELWYRGVVGGGVLLTSSERLKTIDLEAQHDSK